MDRDDIHPHRALGAFQGLAPNSPTRHSLDKYNKLGQIKSRDGRNERETQATGNTAFCQHEAACIAVTSRAIVRGQRSAGRLACDYTSSQVPGQPCARAWRAVADVLVKSRWQARVSSSSCGPLWPLWRQIAYAGA